MIGGGGIEGGVGLLVSILSPVVILLVSMHASMLMSIWEFLPVSIKLLPSIEEDTCCDNNCDAILHVWVSK